jgi:hypothetical protein
MLDVADVEECIVEDRGIKGEARGERKLNTRNLLVQVKNNFFIVICVNWRNL